MQEWMLTVAEAAELLGVTERAVQKNAFSGKYGELRYIQSNTRSRGGRLLQIPLTALPVAIQIAYTAKHHLQTEPEHLAASAYDAAPAWQREKANQRYEKLKHYEAHMRQPGKKMELTDAFVDAWNAAHPDDTVSRSTLYNYQKAYRANGLAGLLTGYGKREGQRDIDDAALAFFHREFLRDSRPSVSDVYYLLESAAKENNWKIPSLATMQRIAKQDIPEGVKKLRREGKKSFYDNVQTFTRRDPDSIQAGQVYVGDHYRFDFFVWTGSSWVRPWLTAWLDMRSHKLVGWYISLSPNTDTIIAAFAEAALDPAIGLPRDILVDNGRDYCSHRFAGRGARGKKLTEDDKKALKAEGKMVETLMDRLKIKAHFAIVENARAKVIEREFRNIVEWFSKRMPTYCGRNPDERPEALKAKLKSDKYHDLTLDKLQSLFPDWARHVFNKRVSQKGAGRQGECPDETFARTRLPVRTADVSVMQLFFMKQTNPFKVGRNGITFQGREYYWADSVLYKGKYVYIRCRPENPETIWLYNKDDEPLGWATVLESTVGINEAPEKIANEAKRKGVEKKRITSHKAYQDATNAEPLSIEQTIALQKAYGNNAPDLERTKIIEMVTTGSNAKEAARAMQTTGTDGINFFEMIYGAK